MKMVWNLCVFLFVLLCVLTFTPLVIPKGQTAPWLLGMPRTLWSGLLISIGLFFITLIAARTSKHIE